MKKFEIFGLAVLLLCLCVIISSTRGQQATLNAQCNIIPAPQQVVFSRGRFALNKTASIVCPDKSMREESEKLKAYLAKQFGSTVSIVEKVADINRNVIVMETVAGKGEEFYQLSIDAEKIVCKASAPAGMYYAWQSLVQSADNAGNVPCMDITDEPRYVWRGYLLDEDNKFFGKETVKQYLDVMAHLKLNRFHWNLSGGTAFRVQIRKYPKLSEGIEFYTQDDIREIVEYARQRHIMVIPCMNAPGHCTAITRAYPEISAGGEGRWNGFTVHPAKEATYEFINNLLTELAELFPVPYIQIGGDEVHFGNQSWDTDPVIQKFIKDNQLGDKVGMEHYFIRRYCDMVVKLGKTPLGWDEITKAGVPAENVMILWWRDQRVLLENLMTGGYRVVLAPVTPCYLDYFQDASHQIVRKKTPNTLELLYAFPENFRHVDLIADREKQIPGIMACMWTHNNDNKQVIDFLTFPRLAALAEDAWTNAARKDKTDFDRRLQLFLKYLDGKSIYYYNPFNPASTPEPELSKRQ
jgi:hexosaminidase